MGGGRGLVSAYLEDRVERLEHALGMLIVQMRKSLHISKTDAIDIVEGFDRGLSMDMRYEPEDKEKP